MGANLPFGRRVSLEWIEAHIEQWSADPAAIGLAPAQIAALAAQIAGARDDFSGAQHARNESRARTQHWHAGADALREGAAGLIAAIKAFADNNTNPAGVYKAAGMTARQAAAPLPPPEQPGDLNATLNGTGSVTISWDGRGPTGTVYNVSRRLPGEQNFAIIGQGSGRNKSFTDDTIPAATASAAYMVQAVRGDQKSAPSGVLSVLFGKSPKSRGEMGIAA